MARAAAASSAMWAYELGRRKRPSLPSPTHRGDPHGLATQPTRCLFLADDGTLKWVGVNTGVFENPLWGDSGEEKIRVLLSPGNGFPRFPKGDWNVGQVRRVKKENGESEIVFSETRDISGISSDTLFAPKGSPDVGLGLSLTKAWHETEPPFTSFELVEQVEFPKRLWRARHPEILNEDGSKKDLFLKIFPWADWVSKKSLENEMEVYRRADGLGITPQFLGHVMHYSRVIGFVTEFVEGNVNTDAGRAARRANDKQKKYRATSGYQDKCAQSEVLQKLHDLGVAYGWKIQPRKDFLQVPIPMPIDTTDNDDNDKKQQQQGDKRVDEPVQQYRTLITDFEDAVFDSKAPEWAKIDDTMAVWGFQKWQRRAERREHESKEVKSQEEEDREKEKEKDAGPFWSWMIDDEVEWDGTVPVINKDDSDDDDDDVDDDDRERDWDSPKSYANSDYHISDKEEESKYELIYSKVKKLYSIDEEEEG
ncbi:hypothetical protein F5Y16DRAFT_399240 [Xylariaceae sp. FL0255]|nr:hypothetical protein F5Y16DRAFT_399240 [Xylariaceae sp. FL0255]